ncbi:MAG: hypothetical protein V3V97_22855 [Hyphomicrobiaceae bacterium]
MSKDKIIAEKSIDDLAMSMISGITKGFHGRDVQAGLLVTSAALIPGRAWSGAFFELRS